MKSFLAKPLMTGVEQDTVDCDMVGSPDGTAGSMYLWHTTNTYMPQLSMTFPQPGYVDPTEHTHYDESCEKKKTLEQIEQLTLLIKMKEFLSQSPPKSNTGRSPLSEFSLPRHAVRSSSSPRFPKKKNGCRAPRFGFNNRKAPIIPYRQRKAPFMANLEQASYPTLSLSWRQQIDIISSNISTPSLEMGIFITVNSTRSPNRCKRSSDSESPLTSVSPGTSPSLSPVVGSPVNDSAGMENMTLTGSLLLHVNSWVNSKRRRVSKRSGAALHHEAAPSNGVDTYTHPYLDHLCNTATTSAHPEPPSNQHAHLTTPHHNHSYMKHLLQNSWQPDSSSSANLQRLHSHLSINTPYFATNTTIHGSKALYAPPIEYTPSTPSYMELSMTYPSVEMCW